MHQAYNHVRRVLLAVANESEQVNGWRQDGQDRWRQMHQVAVLMNRLLEQNPVPSDPNQPLPTPTAAAWATTQTVVQQVADVAAFVDSRQPDALPLAIIGSSLVAPTYADLMQSEHVSLRHELLKNQYNLLSGHMSDPNLDVGDLMRCACKPYHWLPFVRSMSRWQLHNAQHKVVFHRLKRETQRVMHSRLLPQTSEQVHVWQCLLE